MKNIFLTFVLATGCSTYVPPETPKTTYDFNYEPPDYSVVLPDGSRGYSFKCEDMPSCYKMAGVLCSTGYSIVDGEKEERSDSITIEQYLTDADVAHTEGFTSDKTTVDAEENYSEIESKKESTTKYITIQCKNKIESATPKGYVKFTTSVVSKLYIDNSFVGLVNSSEKQVDLIPGEHKVKIVNDIGTKEVIVVVLEGTTININIDMTEDKKKEVESGWQTK